MRHDKAVTTSSSPERGVFANRTLNLRRVPVIGYDMDYTLIHYDESEWEGAVFDVAVGELARLGLPVEGFSFEPEDFTVGLTFDLELGNVVKATRFGRIVKAQHGRDLLAFEKLREHYTETIVELSSPRFRFMNTLFELSRASLFCQLVARHDQEPLPSINTYGDIYRIVDDALAVAHLGGSLKAAIVADKDRFVDLDPNIAATLSDQRLAGKRLVLITNSDWAYTREMMPYCFDRYLPDGQTWRSLFDIVIVSANKPRFFVEADPIYRVVDEDESLLHPHSGPLLPGQVYFGGNARLVEESLGLDGGQPLYVGDHLFGDVHVTKDELRWRTALIARELECEISDATHFARQQTDLEELMADKVVLDHRQATLRLERERARAEGDTASVQTIGDQLSDITAEAIALDSTIGPLAKASGELGNGTWGPLMRAGNDKSLFARQVERYADVYTSRVSNFGYETPFAYLRAARGSLPHDAASRSENF